MKNLKQIKVFVLFYLICSSSLIVKSLKLKQNTFKETANNAANKITALALVLTLNPSIINNPCEKINHIVSINQEQIVKRFDTLLLKLKQKLLTGFDLLLLKNLSII